MFTTLPSHTIFYYSTWQPIYESMKNENLVQEWKNECPQKEYIEELAEKHSKSGGLTVIIDDLISQINKDMVDLFQVVSHHSNVNIFFIAQNLFQDDKKYRNMRLNANYIVLFKNPANQKQATTFINQFSPLYSKQLLDVYNKITRRGYSYLLFDLHQDTPDEIRVRTKVFPQEGLLEVYVPPNLSL